MYSHCCPTNLRNVFISENFLPIRPQIPASPSQPLATTIPLPVSINLPSFYFLSCVLPHPYQRINFFAKKCRHFGNVQSRKLNSSQRQLYTQPRDNDSEQFWVDEACFPHASLQDGEESCTTPLLRQSPDPRTSKFHSPLLTTFPWPKLSHKAPST